MKSTKTLKGPTDDAATPAAAPKPANLNSSNEPARARIEHTVLLGAWLYRTGLSDIVGKDNELLETARLYFLDLINRFNPRDPIEEMLITQMATTHARVLYLNSLAAQQKNMKWSTHFHDSADRACNTFRRQMLALGDYRRPPRPKNFTIGQANIANQQIVQNQPSPKDPVNGNATNEQGCSREGDPLLPEPTRPGRTSTERREGEALAEEHRTED